MPDDTAQIRLILSQMGENIGEIANRSQQDLQVAIQSGLPGDQIATWSDSITQLRIEQGDLAAAGMLALLQGHAADVRGLQAGTAQLTAALQQIKEIERAIQFYAIWIPAVLAIGQGLAKGDLQGAFKNYNDAAAAWKKATDPAGGGAGTRVSSTPMLGQAAPGVQIATRLKAGDVGASLPYAVTINVNVGAGQPAAALATPAFTQQAPSYAAPASASALVRPLSPVAAQDVFPRVCVDLDIRKFGKEKPLEAMGHAIRSNSANIPAMNHPVADSIVEHAMADKLGSLPASHASLASFMAIVTGKKWSPGQQLIIGFMNGTDIQKQKVRAHAAEWLQYANIDFAYSGNEQGQVRIAFGPDTGSWSAIGTDSLAIPNDQPTMNFGWLLDQTADDEYNRVVVHEFGHALGCVHEHQNPSGGILWNKPVVYAYYEGPPNNWTAEEVDLNIFQTYSSDRSQTAFTPVDAQSIMMYPIPPGFTTNGYTVGWNKDLSATDESFITTNYPK